MSDPRAHSEAEWKRLKLVEYDRRCLDLSWTWLNDPEIKELTMTPDFTRDDQESFFKSLPIRADYVIWGVSVGDAIIGAAGLKNHRGSTAEYWGYIGEKSLWGQGLGKLLVATVEQKAVERGFSILDLRVARTNQRARQLYTRAGYHVSEDKDGLIYVEMRKVLK